MALDSTTSGATMLVVGQLLSKLLTFVLNQLLIRYISPTVTGLSAFMEFLVSTALFFSREGGRLAVQRTRSGKSLNGTYQQIINFGYLAIFIGIPITSFVFYWQFEIPLEMDLVKSKLLCLSIASIFLELLIEPLYVLNQFQLNLKKRTYFESLATFGRCLTVFILGSKAGNDNQAILAFAMGQFIYSLIIFIAYLVDYIKDSTIKTSLFISKVTIDKQRCYFDKDVFKIWKNIFIQMIFKEFLSEGDHLLINYFCTLEEQGVYSLITNYGSLVARLLFNPIEESLRLYLTKLLAKIETNKKGKLPTKELENIETAKTIIKYLTIFYTNLCILIVMAGYTNAPFLLRILMGQASLNWEKTELFSTFPSYILYIPFLAFNGIFESFFNSVATRENITKHSMFMSLSSVLFLLASYIFIDYFKLGITGLIMANMANMSLRIIYCLLFIRDYFAPFTSDVFDITGLMGSFSTGIICGTLQWNTLGYSFITTSFAQLFKSAGCCIVFVITTLFVERNLVRLAFSNYMKK